MQRSFLRSVTPLCLFLLAGSALLTTAAAQERTRTELSSQGSQHLAALMEEFRIGAFGSFSAGDANGDGVVDVRDVFHSSISCSPKASLRLNLGP